MDTSHTTALKSHQMLNSDYIIWFLFSLIVGSSQKDAGKNDEPILTITRQSSTEAKFEIHSLNYTAVQK